MLVIPIRPRPSIQMTRKVGEAAGEQRAEYRCVDGDAIRASPCRAAEPSSDFPRVAGTVCERLQRAVVSQPPQRVHRPPPHQRVAVVHRVDQRIADCGRHGPTQGRREDPAGDSGPPLVVSACSGSSSVAARSAATACGRNLRHRPHRRRAERAKRVGRFQSRLHRLVPPDDRRQPRQHLGLHGRSIVASGPASKAISDGVADLPTLPGPHCRRRKSARTV